MKIEVIAKADEVRQEDLVQKTVIVVDVLRASSTIVTALAAGCKEVIPVETIGQAFHYPHNEAILAGERYGKKIAGFSLNNSPTQMRLEPSLPGKTLVLTTTNGTRAIQKAAKGETILIGCFLNAADCAETAVALRRDITILCAGSRNEFSLEDALGAGCLIAEIKKRDAQAATNDCGEVLLLAYWQAQDRLAEHLLQSATGKRLLQAGFQQDVSFCAQRNAYSLTPVLKNQRIISFTAS
ncbi:2-phosphosulfolactate phosphatase family protein [Bacillaceae bacterium]